MIADMNILDCTIDCGGRLDQVLVDLRDASELMETETSPISMLSMERVEIRAGSMNPFLQ